MDHDGSQDHVPFEPGDALLIADVQVDFLPGGALGVRGGDEVVPVVNEYLRRAQAQGIPIFITRDWHPPGHCSFHASGGPWPPHCIAGTVGAEFAPGLALPADVHVVSKGTAPDREAYSAFAGTDLAERLQRADVRRLLVGGLTTDYCVLNTVMDARALGYPIVVLLDAVRAVDAKHGDGDAAIAQMVRLGARTARLPVAAAGHQAAGAG